MRLFKRKEFDRISKQAVDLSEFPRECIPTKARDLDKLLGGGIPVGYITHIYGPAGSGKTNICLAVGVELAKHGKKTLFLDTEGGFSLERFEQIARNKELAKKILLKQAFDFEEQKLSIRALGRILNKEFGLIVVDSIVSLYRLQVTSNRKQLIELSRELGKELAWLSALARKLKLAVIICNQVYTSFDNNNSSSISYSKKQEIVPVGGDVLLYWSKVILELDNCSEPSSRVAILRKHPFLPEGKSIKFRITDKGLE